MRSRLEPFKKFARTLRNHHYELMNWFLPVASSPRAPPKDSTTKPESRHESYGFRTYSREKSPLSRPRSLARTALARRKNLCEALIHQQLSLLWILATIGKESAN